MSDNKCLLMRMFVYCENALWMLTINTFCLFYFLNVVDAYSVVSNGYEYTHSYNCLRCKKNVLFFFFLFKTSL